jgi:glutamine amidotransferase
MKNFNNSGMRLPLEEMVVNRGVPILGVCVGMQMLSGGSDEGVVSGLNWIPGRVRSFQSNNQSCHLPMPHMGWNTIRPTVESKLFCVGFESPPQFYFLHSFYFDAECNDDVSATAEYGFQFDAVVSRGNIHGIQCHPEKSHSWGVQFLKNFAES